MAGSDAEDILEQWDRKIHTDRLGKMFSGCYYKFENDSGVFSEGADDFLNTNADIGADTPCILTSCSKVWAGTAVMRTMHLRPNDWYPEKAMHEFKGWEEWKDFHVYDNLENTDGKAGWSGRTAPKITIHNLLTHTSGWAFGLRGSRQLVLNMPLYFEPGEYFGYSIGHRILGWMLLDYWKDNAPEGRNFEKLDDVFSFLMYEPLELKGTYFIRDKFECPHSIMGEFFDMTFFDNPNEENDNDPADLAMASTGTDMMKLAMMALRRGRLPNGDVYIEKWDEWAATNQLKDGKLSAACSHWHMEGRDDVNFLWRTMLTRTINSGPFGWSYFGATYHDVADDCEECAGPAIAVGWKGFSSCGLRADYEQNIAFVAMQEIVPDPGNRNMGECIHKGKMGSYKLIDCAQSLYNTSKDEQERLRQDYPKKCKCLHKVMTETDSSGLCMGFLQCVIRSAYKCFLPCGVKVLEYHKYEQLGREKEIHEQKKRGFVSSK